MEEKFNQIIFELQETSKIEFKRSMPWNGKNSGIIKDILALSNTPGGGYIIIGVEEDKLNNKLIATGMQKEHIESYNSDDICDQIARYADPEVVIKIKHYEKDSKEYIFIEIDEFENFPIICKRSNQELGLYSGDIYYRTKKGKPSSAKINHHDDLREIIERATINRINYFKNIGAFKIMNNSSDNYKNELVEPANQKIFKEISQDIHLVITIHPIKYKDNVISLSECQEIVEKNSVNSKYAFPFPVNKDRYTHSHTGNTYFEAEYDSRHFSNHKYKQIWQVYQSGQIKFYYQLEHNQSNNQSSISIIELLITITKLFRFIIKLISSKNGLQLYMANGLTLKIELKNINNTKLMYPENFTLDGELYRPGFFRSHIASCPEIPFAENYTCEEILYSDELARKVTSHFMQRFNYNEIPNYFQKIQESIESQGL